MAQYAGLSSSCLVDVSYDEPSQTLEVRFRRDGSRYRYFGVPYEVFVDIKGVVSAGRYFNAQILHAYAYERA